MSGAFGRGKIKLSVLVGIPVALFLFMSGMMYASKSYASEEYWLVQADDKELAVLSSQAEAKQVVDGVKNAYVVKGAKVESITTDKELKVVNKNFNNGETPKIMSPDKAISKIIKGVKSPKTYTVKTGDTAWGIAEDNGLGYEEFLDINKGYDPEKIMPGDEVVIEKMVPYVNITTVQTFDKEEAVEAEVQYEDTDSLYEGQTEVKEAGEAGTKKVTLKQKNINGAVSDSKTIKESVTKEAKPQIVLRGTKIRQAANSYTATGSYSSNGNTTYNVPSAAGYSGSGASVAAYASQFVGAPYVWGGTNLSTGVDCSGFVVAVYRALGYNITRSFGSYGRYVSPSSLQPGDVVAYANHYSIYLGGGREIHALNPRQGVMITRLGGGGAGPIVSAIRIVE